MNITPQNLELEQSILGAILIDHKLINTIKLSSEVFYDERNQAIFQAMTEMSIKHQPIDLLTLSTYLEENKKLTKAGGREYLVSLTQIVPNISHIGEYAKSIEDKYIRRKLIKESMQAIEDLYDESKDVEQATEKIKRAVVGYHQQNYEVSENPKMTDDWFREYGAERKPLVRTGMPGLDFSFGGFAQHQLGVIVANSNVGKTTFAINMAINMAREGKRVLFFSLEMPAFEIIDKCISITGNHNAFEIFNRSKRSELLLETVFQFQDYPITIISRGSITSQDVIAEAYSRVMNNEVDVVFVDYLQLLTDRFGDNEQQRLTRIAQNLKNFCLTYNVPIITPAQVDKESSKSGAIRLENIAGAKSIGDSADVSFYLYEKENKTSMTEDGETEIRLKIVKSRTSTKYQDMLVNFDRQTLKMTIE